MHDTPAVPLSFSADRERTPVFNTPPPLALYLHFPWCVRKCPYCDFNSHALDSAASNEQRWLDAIIADLEAALPTIWGRSIVSIFIGGGTPSLMSATTLDALLAALRMRLSLLPDAEITLEANPGTVEAERFRDYRAAGVTRLSLGIQSFNDTLLAAIGRIHDGNDARRAIDIALNHFERVNLDLMYALPNQTPQQALTDLETTLATGVGHLSCYHLTLEPNTAFGLEPPPVPDDDIAADMQQTIETRLSKAGFEHYETSAFARPGERCRHNLNYWTFGDYLGLGPGAHGKITSASGVIREMRHKHPSAYLQATATRDFIQQTHPVDTAQLPFEFMMNALRLTEGFAPTLFTQRTGLPLSAIHRELEQAEKKGLLEATPLLIRPTEKGQRFLNDLLQIFLR